MKNYKKKSILCVILARGGSKGIPKKNIFILNNHPLISYTIEAAKKSKFIDKIIVSTDNLQIAQIAKKYGAEVPFLRPKKLATDKTPSVDALNHAVKKTEQIFNKKYDYVIELPCVAPLRDHDDIDKAISILVKKKYDSVISYVNTGEKHPIRLKRIKNNKVESFCKEYREPDTGSRRQDFEPCFIRNGAIYAMTRNCILNLQSRNGKKSFPYIMTSEKSINIDEKFDLQLASLLIENGKCLNRPSIVNKFKNEIYNNKKSKINILISAPFNFLEKEKKELIKNFNCTFTNNLKKENIISCLNNKHGWICHPSPEFLIDKKILEKNKHLKLISTPSTGTTHIDLDYCKKKKISVISITRSKKFNQIKASSEYTFLLSLLSQRKIFDAIKLVKNGYWRNIENTIRGNELFKKKIAIIGYGRIGQNLEKYFRNFGVTISIYDPHAVKKSKNLKQNLKQVINHADIVILCISYSKRNHNFVNNGFFSKMKYQSIFINTSRGEVVEEKALIKSLKSKKIKLAFTDVVKQEQYLNYKKNLLIEYSKKNKNLIITPHIAGLTFESEKKAANISIKHIINFFKT